MARIDTSFLQARPFLAPQTAKVTLALCGLGGTGSWLAPHVVRIARALEERGQHVDVLFIDPDVVEEKNLTRQNFCQAEVGMEKAATLALRYGVAWQIAVEAICAPFEEALLPWGGDRFCVLIGAVDNAAARRSLNGILRRNEQYHGEWEARKQREVQPPRYVYLDLGNALDSGQCLLGTAVTVDDLRYAFASPGICSALPAPLLQDPSLSMARPEELHLTVERAEAQHAGEGTDERTDPNAPDMRSGPLVSDDWQAQATLATTATTVSQSGQSSQSSQSHSPMRGGHEPTRPTGTAPGGLSCAELIQANLQSPAINPLMAAIGAEYLWSLLLTGGVRRFATYLSLSPGVMASSWTTPEQVARAVAVAPTVFFPPTTTIRAARQRH